MSSRTLTGAASAAVPDGRVGSQRRHIQLASALAQNYSLFGVPNLFINIFYTKEKCQLQVVITHIKLKTPKGLKIKVFK